MKGLHKYAGALAAALVALSAGCDGGETNGQEPPASICANETRDDAYAAGMEKQGAEGKLRVRLVEGDPAPPAKGENTWTIQVLDAAGAPVSGATLTVTPRMPDHGHGSGVVPSVMDLGTDGEYEISAIDLAMAGLWEVTILVTTGAGESDTVKFAFCVEG
jgi:hypothetical protein